MKTKKVLLTFIVVIVFALFAMASGSTESTDQGHSDAVPAETNSSELGDYSVTIDSCRLASDWEGKPVVIVKYIYENVSSDTSTAFFMAFEENVYQNGVGLNESYFVGDDANYNSDNQTKELKKGASLEVEVAYELNDTSSDIEVEVSELFSWDDKVITKTFSIAQ